MANCLFTTENYIDSTYYNPVIHSGNWEGNLPLSNLVLDDLSKAAQSTSAAETDTQLEIDLAVVRDVGIIVIPSTNTSLSGQVSIEACSSPKFSGCTVNTAAAIGGGEIVFKAWGDGATITTGDVFTINNYTYKSATTVTITAFDTAIITLDTPEGFGHATLQTALVEGDIITCNSGDFSTTLYDSGYIDVIPRIYDFESLPFGSPSFWTGKPTDEKRISTLFPVIVKPDNLIVARYWRIKFTDTGNTDGFIKLPRIFISNYMQLTVNPSYGATHGLQTDTTRDTSLGDIDTYEVRGLRRVQGFNFENIPENEALSEMYEFQTFMGTNKQTFFIFDPLDSVHMHRRAYTATLNTLNPLAYPYHTIMSGGVETREVLGGNMNI